MWKEEKGGASWKELRFWNWGNLGSYPGASTTSMNGGSVSRLLEPPRDLHICKTEQ